jgi:hypothetical protein
MLVVLAGCRSKAVEPAPGHEEPERASGPASIEKEVARHRGVSEPEPAARDAGPDLIAIGTDQARVKFKSSAQVKYNQAKKAKKDDDRARAIQLLDESLAEDPTLSWAVMLRARMHLQDGEKEKCAALLERLVAYNYVHFAPQVSRLAWLKPLRGDEAVWGPFEEKMEDYRKAWIEALSGPGAFFIQSSFRKVEGTDAGGEPLDLRWARGVPVFWSKTLGRYLVIGEHQDVAGFLLDRDHDALILVRWRPLEEPEPGMMGKVLLQRIDLSTARADPRSIEIAEQAEILRFALDSEGRLLFTDLPPGQEEQEAEQEDGDEEAVEAVDEELDEELEEEEEEEEEEEVEGLVVPAVDWEKGKVEEGVLDEQEGWLLTITLGSTQGPAPLSAVETEDEPPRAKRGGACLWIESSSALCFEPTKKGGTWHNLDLVASGAEPVRLTGEPVPLVQY